MNIKQNLEWQTTGLKRKAPTELLMQRTLDDLFPEEKNHKIVRARKAIDMKMPKSTHYLETDAAYIRLRLYFEYQDPCHYKTIWYSQVPLKIIKERDDFKLKALTARGETLIQVPPWWDGERDSLAATIKAVRPDLLQHIHPSCPPISSSVPEDFFTDDTIPGIGELMHPSFISKRELDDRIWWLGEKYDGYRGCWNPRDRMLYTRTGKLIRFHESLLSLMPDEYLEGELWFGRGFFAEAIGLHPNARSTAVNWPNLRFIVFDSPDPFYIENKTCYEERYEKLLSVIDLGHPFIKLAPRIYANKERVSDIAQAIMKSGGEGVILQEQQSPYEPGRSHFVWKFKLTRDEEALVIDSNSKHVTLKRVNGILFRIPAPKLRRVSHLPKKGDVVTFSFTGFINGERPKSPHIQRVRSDVTWGEVIASAEKDAHFRLGRHLDYSSLWRGTKDDMREYFEEHARKANFNSCVATNWYNVKASDILAIPGARWMINSHFKGSIVKALLYLFPEIGLEESKFSRLPQRYWQEGNNIRDFFERVAKERGFDPLVEGNWYRFPFSQIKNKANIATVANLLLSFPELNFGVHQFKRPLCTCISFIDFHFMNYSQFLEGLRESYNAFYSTFNGKRLES